MDKEQNKFKKEIGKRIRDHREFLSYTREQLAEKCDISSQFLADIEVGRKSMTARTLRNISKSLNLSADYILNGTSKHSSGEYQTEQINLLLEGFSPYEKDCALDMLKAFTKALQKKTSE